ncbi:MAG: flagellar hook capping FlgD N-terminal domain-containing protein [Ewingella sp.]|uniref:flagellar hook capping FlgD N-terminal domain-containing protein n=1 Tax=Ewingella TaxID=41201 RepID=UPI0033654BE5
MIQDTSASMQNAAMLLAASQQSAVKKPVAKAKTVGAQAPAASNNVGASSNVGASNNVGSSGGVGDDSSDVPQTDEPSMADTFLTLFVAEIENQDPTEPTDPTEYITQLASMAQVVMAEDLSSQMSNNSILMSNLQVMMLGKMIGDDVMVQASTVTVADGQSITGRVTITDASTTVDLNFKDSAGNEYTVPLGEQSPGPVDFSIDPADYGIPPGDYDISVVTNTGESNIPIEVEGRVTDVRIPLDGSTPVLNVSGVGEVPFIMLTEFLTPVTDGDIPVSFS